MIAAEREMPIAREPLFAFLAHLPNHWRLHDALTEVEATSETTARVRLQGPLGIGRDALTRVEAAVEPERLRGTAEVESGTVARVAWDLTSVGRGTRVRLSTTIERASLADRLVLLLGGSLWLRRVYRHALVNLEREVGRTTQT